MKLSDLKDFRIILYIILILISLFVIIPRGETKVVSVIDVNKESLAYKNGLSPGDIIYSLDFCKVTSLQDFNRCLSYFDENQTVPIKTNRGTILTRMENGSLGFVVAEIPKYPVKLGIDLVGGTRVILKPVEKVEPKVLQIAADRIEQRLNIYGLKEISVKVTSDLSGEQYIVVELPTGEEKLIDILERQGRFEAKVNNITVFTGQDVTYVCNIPQCSGITCNSYSKVCNFYFKVIITDEAAKRFYNTVKDLPTVIGEDGKRYINASLELYLDGKFIDSLRISAAFKERPINEPVIEGSQTGDTVSEAKKNAQEQMKLLQTVLKSGELPVRLEVSSIERISPFLGENFFREILYGGIIALLAVAGVIYARYRNWKVSTLVTINMVVETISTLAVAALIKWTLDLPSIAGILVAIGTGVDDQVVIADEVLYGSEEEKKKTTLRERIKRAFFIVISSYLAFGAAMLPLFWAGVGMLKGFAVTTIIGISIGALITRPAFARILEKVI